MDSQIFTVCNRLNIEITSKLSNKARELFGIWYSKFAGNQIAKTSQQAVPYILLHLASEQRQTPFPLNNAIEFSGISRLQYFTLKDVIAGHLGIQAEQSFSHYAIRLGSSGLQDFCTELKSSYQRRFKETNGPLQFSRQNWEVKELFGSILTLCSKYLGIKIPRDIQNEIKGNPKIFKNYCNAIEIECKEYLLEIQKKYGKLSLLKSTKDSPNQPRKSSRKRSEEMELSSNVDEMISATDLPTVMHSPVRKVPRVGRISKDSTPKKSTPLKQSFKNTSQDSDSEVESRTMKTRSSRLQNAPEQDKRSPTSVQTKTIESDAGSNKSTPTKPIPSRKTPKTQSIKRVADQNLAISPNDTDLPTPSKSVRNCCSLKEPETPIKKSLEDSGTKKSKWSTVKTKKPTVVTGVHSMVPCD
ncbi:hypothetical protein HDV01_000565 [Terramyces sp. JEL0728]|nr:hypothetical protein HDV01_000565 [Terramyces sp. JEL0728]